MIVIRKFESNDIPRLQCLHRKQGLDYNLPKISDSSIVGAVIEEDAIVTNVLLLRRTAEVYWIFDPEGTKRDKLGRFLALSRELPFIAKHGGYEDLHCWIPPEISQDKKFDATMHRMGWSRPLWTSYSLEVK